MPEQRPKAAGYAFDGNEGIYFKYRHPFLHAAVIQRFIVRAGFLADTNDMWSGGVLLKTADGTALVEALAEKDEIVLRLKGPNHKALLDKIRNELKEINHGEEGIRESVSLDGKTFVLLENLRKQPAGNEKIEAENGEWVNAADYFSFLSRDEQLRFDKTKDQPVKMQSSKAGKPVVYFSYAWRDTTNEDREKFVDALYNNLKEEDEYIVVRDKADLGYKESISEFMQKIGRGNVVVAISDKYLKSEYCMYELYELYRNSKLEKAELLKKIFPVRVEQLDLKRASVIGRYMDYWEAQEKEWEELVTRLAKRIAPEQQEEYNKIKSIASALGKLLPFLADINPLNTELLSKDNFAEIKKALKKSVAEGQTSRH